MEEWRAAHDSCPLCKATVTGQAEEALFARSSVDSQEEAEIDEVVEETDAGQASVHVDVDEVVAEATTPAVQVASEGPVAG